MFRTWFDLCGLCNLPWNHIVPEDNSDTEEPAKMEKHVEMLSTLMPSPDEMHPLLTSIP
jgi:hypothetical protein